jgi:prepilin-type N-terminal cleavage/methylation domain-containing protein
MRNLRRGFTLIEVLVAMSILVVIVLIMTQLFHQASVAWEGGLRQVEMSMEGRAALNLISGELAQALADDKLPCTIRPGNTIEFYTSTEPNATNRTVRRVKYTQTADEIRRTQVAIVAATGAEYPVDGDVLADVPVVNRVVSFSFDTPGGATYTNALPPWVSIKLELEKTSGTAQIKVSTLGKDGLPDTADDIRTWE